MRWRKVTLIGVGLLGGSLGQALKSRGLAERVVGFVRREQSIKECLRARAVDEATLDLTDAVNGADLIVLCTPIAQMPALVRRFRGCLRRGAMVTDVGSVKAGVVRKVESSIRQAGGHFVGSHPLAGGEKMGVRFAVPTLFKNAMCVVTPTAQSNRRAAGAVAQLWRSVGARVLRLTPGEHDRLVSRTSHLPHVLAAALTAHVLDPRQPAVQAGLCASGFRDTTRIASGSPEMWRDIAMANRTNLGRELAVICRQLEKLRQWLRAGDAAAIEKFFASAKERRDNWCAGSASPSPE